MQVLARGRAGGRLGETGTGCGVGLAWLASATDAATTLVSVERDPVLAATAERLFQDWPNVSVLHADWTAIGGWAPFDLLVLDAGAKVDPGRLDPVDLLAAHAALVIDDFTPMRTWPPRFAGEIDSDRLHWLEHPLLLSTEIRLTASASTLVATRRQGRSTANGGGPGGGREAGADRSGSSRSATGAGRVPGPGRGRGRGRSPG